MKLSTVPTWLRRHPLIAVVLVAGLSWGSAQAARKVLEIQRADTLRSLAAAPGTIRMLSSNTCTVCEVAHAWLTKHEIPFEMCTIETDTACRAEFEQRRAIGTPTFVLSNGRTELGFQVKKLIASLQAEPLRAP
ncbi:glutaredoxin family protein [Leptothrix discophora]|uniref:Glutaredoxin n=1 Tax=Leptothrix discophora TaxID=89 RepID=A0ABT9FY99_LEPDI|nr:hypothetical protein [Leptothrix discophora]MDP4299211.1 hypothetical protein [Leptothrix discophora]